MREADVAIRLRQPTQPDLIQRKLFTVHFHAYASPEYLKRFGTPRTLEDLDNHRIILLGGATVPTYLQNRNWLIESAATARARARRADHQQRARRVARLPARARRAVLPDYLVEENGGLVQLFGRPNARLRRVFRLSGRAQIGCAHSGVPRFPGAKAQRWHF